MDPKIASPLNQYLVHTNARKEICNKTGTCKDIKRNILHHEHWKQNNSWFAILKNDYTKQRPTVTGWIQFRGDKQEAHWGLSLGPVLQQNFVTKFALLSALFIVAFLVHGAEPSHVGFSEYLLNEWKQALFRQTHMATTDITKSDSFLL